MIILGIDPGSRVTGYGLIQCSAGRIRYKGGGRIKTCSEDLPGRLKTIFENLSVIIEQFQPEIAVVEKVFISVNPRSALTLGHARGSAICACAFHNLSIYEYTAREIKKTITGTGSATKDQVQFMVQLLLGFNDSKSQDETDALAGAITHFQITPAIDAIDRTVRCEVTP